MRVLDIGFCYWSYKSYGPDVAYTLCMAARYHYNVRMLRLKKYDCRCLLERRYEFSNGLAATAAYKC